MFDYSFCYICKRLQGCMCHMCSTTLHLINHPTLSFHLKVSTIYNAAISTSNSEIFVNSVIILFIMELDKGVFSALEACNPRWTERFAESGDLSIDEDASIGSTIDLEEEIVLLNRKISSLSNEIVNRKEMEEEILLQKKQMQEMELHQKKQMQEMEKQIAILLPKKQNYALD